MIEEALIQHLKGAGTGAGSRVYPDQAPQGTAWPVILVVRVSGGPINADDGSAGIEEARMQIDIIGTTRGSVRTVARQVQSALNGFSGTMQAVEVQSMFIEDIRDFAEEATAGEILRRTSIDILTIFEE